MDYLGAVITFNRRCGILVRDDRRDGLCRPDGSSVADVTPDRGDSGPRSHTHCDSVQPAPDRLTVADRNRSPSQNQEDGLEGVVNIVRVVEHVAAHAHHHRPVPRHQGFKSQIARLVTTGQETLEQLPIGHAGIGPNAEEHLHVVGEQLGRCVGHDS